MQAAQIALLVTAAAALAAWLLGSVFHLTENVVVVSVMVMAFVASWIVSNPRPASNHRVTLIRVRVASR